MVGEPWEIGQREEFRSRFGEDADAYDRTRPVAPAAVFDELVRLAGLGPGASAVEIGPGTGQATRPLAERGLEIVALEIDGRLAARAAENLADLPLVTVRATSFEQWDPGDRRFDMVFACNSFHWIDPDVRFTKAAAAPGASRLARGHVDARGRSGRGQPLLVGRARRLGSRRRRPP